MKKASNAAKIEYIPISEIREYENNPRDNDRAVDAVAKSIQRFGVRSPAIVDKDNVLIAGHTRIKAAKQLGMTEFPCVRAGDLTKAQAKALRLADNRIQEDSTWDVEFLRDEFKTLAASGFDVGETGFTSFEIDGINLPDDYTAEDEPEEYYDTPEMESGEYDYGDDFDDDDDTVETGTGSKYFVCILCLKGDEGIDEAKELLGETGPLKGRYTVTQIRKMLEG